MYKNDLPQFFEVALRSIFHDQTLKPDQIVIVADGELHQTHIDIINSFIDDVGNKIVTFVPLPRNVGLANALNEGLKACRNELVARMDADDISLPHRFEKQISFMINNSEIDVCGSFIDEIETVTEEFISTRKVPLEHREIVKFARKRSAVSHPSVIFRKNTVLAVGGYPPFRKSQDFALWSLLIVHNARFANLPDILLKMRTGRNLMARRGLSYLLYEYKVLYYQYKIGFIRKNELISNAMLRTFFRIMPSKLKELMYSIVRNR
ncbi:TPA: glycosyltransferase [Shigella flexneri]